MEFSTGTLKESVTTMFESLTSSVFNVVRFPSGDSRVKLTTILPQLAVISLTYTTLMFKTRATLNFVELRKSAFLVAFERIAQSPSKLRDRRA